MAKEFTLGELAKLTESTSKGDPSYKVSGIDELSSAKPGDVSFLANPRYLEAMKASDAGIICIDDSHEVQNSRNFLISDNPSQTFQRIAKLMLDAGRTTSYFQGIHASAVIAEDVEIGLDVEIGPNVSIDSGVKIGANTKIKPNVVIERDVEIGTGCTIYPQVTIREGSKIGNRVILQPGAVIGSCGFGYITNERGEHQKLEQMGSVICEDDVEIGANTTIDRARFKETRISKGTKIDNLVQIGHNVTLGEHNIIVSQTGIAGSTKTGKYVVMGGQVGIVGHIEIGDHVQIATRGGVSKSIKKPGGYRGAPVMPIAEYNRYKIHQRKIASYLKRIEALEQRLK